jgi:hypothetical protein
MPSLELIDWEKIASGPEPIPNTTSWLNPTVPMQPAREYWQQQRKAGEPVDMAKINELGKSREYHLEEVCLLNGLRYVIIKDDEGNNAFDTSEFSDLSRGFATETTAAIRDVSLGGGYVLNSVLLSQANNSNNVSVVSCVEKKADDTNGGEHRLEYQIDPSSKDFDGRYSYRRNEVYEELEFYGQERLTLSVGGRTGEVEFVFDHEGAISTIMAAGRYLLGATHARPETLPLDDGSQKGVLSFDGDTEIDSSFARSLFASTFTVPVEGVLLSEVRLVVPAVIGTMVQNVISGDLSLKPHDFVQLALNTARD